MVLMTKEMLGIIAVALVFVTYIPYILDILKKKVKPHPFTWFVWMITASSIFLLQITNGAGSGAYPTAFVAVFALFVFILALRNNRLRPTTIDVVCLIVACIGIGSWMLIDIPWVSISLMLFVEITGFTPTFLKGWRKPYEESVSMWGTNAARHIFAISAVQNYGFITMINPITWMTLSTIFCVQLLYRRTIVPKPKQRKRQFRPYN